MLRQFATFVLSANYDSKANDGKYTGGIHIEELYPYISKRGGTVEGYWNVYVFAQDVNLAPSSIPPTEAATYVGGMPIHSPGTLTFNTDLPCPLTADASVLVYL